jgi:hypothetical protein
MSYNNQALIEQKFRATVQPLLSQWDQFKNAIYSELRLIKHDLLVHIALTTGKSGTVFQEIELPLFKTIASPTSKNWNARLTEELEKLQYLRTYCHEQIIFKEIELDHKNPRIFNCRGEFLIDTQVQQVFFQIRLPMRYPHEMPIADNYGFLHYIQPAGEHRNACLGKIKERWNEDGSMGVAHFLLMLSYYTAMALFTGLVI